MKIVYNDIASDELIEPYNGVKETLQELKKNHQLGLVTYGTQSIQYKKLEKAGIESSLFSNIVVTKNRNKKPSYKEILEMSELSPMDFLVVTSFSWLTPWNPATITTRPSFRY